MFVKTTTPKPMTELDIIMRYARLYQPVLLYNYAAADADKPKITDTADSMITVTCKRTKEIMMARRYKMKTVLDCLAEIGGIQKVVSSFAATILATLLLKNDFIAKEAASMLGKAGIPLPMPTPGANIDEEKGK